MRAEWLVFAGGLLLTLPALAWRARPRPEEAELDAWSLVPALTGWAVVVVGSWLAFAFYADDHQYLVLSHLDPFAIEPQRRLLGIQIPFFLARAVGGAAPFAVWNLAALVAAAAALGALLRTGGWSRTEAWLAALLFGTALPSVELLPWAAGFQQLAAWALVLGAAAAMNAAADASGRRRATLAALAVGLSMGCVITKWPLALLASPLGWTFGALARRRAPHTVALASALAVAAALALVEPELGAFHAGLDGVLANLAAAGQRLGELAGRVGLALALVVVVRTGVRRSALSNRALLAAFFLGRSSRDTVRPALALGALSLAPFLFNDTYFAGYYLGPAIAWVAAFAARALAAWLPERRRGALAAVVFAALWFPHAVVIDRWTDPRYEQLEAALGEAALALAEAPSAGSISITARCPDPAESTRSARELDRIWAGAEGPWGFRWVSGRYPTRFERDGAPSGPVLLYCASSTPRFELAPP